MMRVPDGWFDYSRFGSPIDCTRIVAVKTPLKEIFNSGRPARECGDYTKILRGVPLEEEFTPRQMLKQFKEKGWNVGLVIDLTFTDRYYDPQEFVNRGVSHLKIKCPGQVIPPDDVYQKLCAGISEFLSDPKNGDDLVAVHCTHGLNRTGYLVCRYLVEECGYNADQAIAAFNEGRGSSIERENFLEHLRNGCPKNDSSPGRSSGQLVIDHNSHHSYRHSDCHHRSASDVCDDERRRGEVVSGGRGEVVSGGWRERRRGEVVSGGRGEVVSGDDGELRERRRGEVVNDDDGGRKKKRKRRRRHGNGGDSSGQEVDLRSKLDRSAVSRSEESERMGYYPHHTDRSRECEERGNSRKRARYVEDICEGDHDYSRRLWRQHEQYSYHYEDEAAPSYRATNYHRGVDTWTHPDHWEHSSARRERGRERERKREWRGRW